MKKLVSFFFLLLTIAVCNAQKVDLDRFYFKATYRNLPKSPLGLEYKSFVVEPKFASSISKIISPDEVKDKFIIEGFKRIDANGDLLIKFNVNDITLYRTEVKSRVEEKKDKAGNVTERKTFYWFEIEYGMEASADIINNKTSKSLHNFALAANNPYSKKIFKLSETSSYNGARDAYALNKEMVLRNIINECFTEYFSTVNDFATNEYGYKVVTADELVWISASKKHPETEAYANNFNLMKDAFSLMTSDAPIDQVKEKLQPVIEYLNGLVKKYTADEKPDRKLRYSAFYNLGKIYLYLDMPDEAIAQGNALITNDYDTGDGKRIIESANKLKESFKVNNTNSRHFERNLSDIL